MHLFVYLFQKSHLFDQLSAAARRFFVEDTSGTGGVSDEVAAPHAVLVRRVFCRSARLIVSQLVDMESKVDGEGKEDDEGGWRGSEGRFFCGEQLSPYLRRACGMVSRKFRAKRMLTFGTTCFRWKKSTVLPLPPV